MSLPRIHMAILTHCAVAVGVTESEDHLADKVKFKFLIHPLQALVTGSTIMYSSHLFRG